MTKIEKLKEMLNNFGFENYESEVYLEALKLWTVPASLIAKNIGISRTSVRYTCENLVKKWLMLETTKWNTKYFTAETPNKIKNLLIVEKNKLEEKEKKLQNNIDDLYEIYNPYTKIPKMTFYEWIEGAKKILLDHLKDWNKIYSFIDMEWIINFFWEIQEWYSKKREYIKISKKNIISSNENLEKKFIKKYKNLKQNIQDEVKYIEWKKLYIVSYLYNWKFSYITLKKWKFFWVIIDDEEFYNYHKTIFDYIWDKANYEL